MLNADRLPEVYISNATLHKKINVVYSASVCLFAAVKQLHMSFHSFV